MSGRAGTAIAFPEAIFGMPRLWRLALWGIAAASMLLLAVLVGRSELGSQRMGGALAALTGRTPLPPAPAARPAFDAEGETRRLKDGLRAIAQDRDRLLTRVTALEQHLDDVTGSFTRELEAARNSAANAPAPPWPAELTPVPSAPATIAATLSPSAGVLPGLPGMAINVAAAPTPPAGATELEFGVDLGGGLTIQALRTRWTAIRAAHPQLFEGLEAIVSVHDTPKPNRVELRLVVGPLADVEAAAQLCSSLAAARVSCQPAVFDGQRLASR
jgi:hypothetical protein